MPERQRQHDARPHAAQHRIDAVADVIEYFRHAACGMLPEARGARQPRAMTRRTTCPCSSPRWIRRTSSRTSRSGYPEPYRSRVLPREVRALGRRPGSHAHRRQPRDAAARQGVLDAPLAHARGRVRVRARGRGGAAHRCGRAAAHAPACAPAFRPAAATGTSSSTAARSRRATWSISNRDPAGHRPTTRTRTSTSCGARRTRAGA